MGMYEEESLMNAEDGSNVGAKLVELLESDPEAIELLNNHFKNKTSGVEPKPKPVPASHPLPVVPAPMPAMSVNPLGVQPMPGNDNNAMFLHTLKATNDNYDEIMKEVGTLVAQEPLKVQMLADSDIEVFMKYFDKAKKTCKGKESGDNVNNLPEIESGNSYIFPGLERGKSEESKVKSVWESSEKDFEKMLRKVKGL